MTTIVILLAVLQVSGSNLSQDCWCGKRQNKKQEIDLKVIKGEEADINEFPWAALLRIRNTSQVGQAYARCGGTLINDR